MLHDAFQCIAGDTGRPTVKLLLERGHHVRRLEEHGVAHDPFGLDGLLNLRCGARRYDHEEPTIEATSNRALTLVVRWDGGTKNVALP